MKYLRRFLLPIIVLLPINLVLAQDILGGEISYYHVSGSTYNITYVIYSKTSMSINHTGTPTTLSHDITKWENTYSHTFPGSGIYNLTFLDSFRISNITNIPNSLNEKIELQSELTINPFQGINNSPTFQFDFSNISISGGNIIYDPNVSEIDGDSLFFDIIPASATNYSFPVGATINNSSGIFSMPFSQGKYTIAIKVEEWRNGIVIGHVIQEITIDTDLITSIKTETHIKNIKVFPNPNFGLFKIELNDVSDSVEVNIFNIAGKLIFSKKQNDNTLNINISNQPKGIYLVRINSEKESVAQKVVVE